MGCGVSKDNHPFYGIGSNADKESKDMKKRSGPKKKRKRKAKKGGKGARKNSHETTNGKHQAIDLGSGFSHTAELTNFLDKETIYKVEEWLFDAAEDIEFQKQTVPGRSVKRPSRPTISPMDRSRNKNVHHLKRLSIREFTTLVPDTLPRTARQGSDALSSNKSVGVDGNELRSCMSTTRGSITTGSSRGHRTSNEKLSSPTSASATANQTNVSKSNLVA